MWNIWNDKSMKFYETIGVQISSVRWNANVRFALFDINNLNNFLQIDDLNSKQFFRERLLIDSLMLKRVWIVAFSFHIYSVVHLSCFLPLWVFGDEL